MTGINRHTGQPIDNLASAIQGVEVILSTPQSSRLMRRSFGAGMMELLGRAITPELFLAFKQLLVLAIDQWEPRFKVREILAAGSADDLRKGTVGLVIKVDYRPNGHKGDERVDSSMKLNLNFASQVVKAT